MGRGWASRWLLLLAAWVLCWPRLGECSLGEDNAVGVPIPPLDCVLLIVSIFCLLIFFSFMEKPAQPLPPPLSGKTEYGRRWLAFEEGTFEGFKV